METWFIGDPHAGHDWVAGLRGFLPTVDQQAHIVRHDEALMRNLNRRVGIHDRLFILGDLVFGPQEEKEARLRMLASVAAETHVILGNHDRPHPHWRNFQDHLPLWQSIFTTVSVTGSIRYRGEKYLLSHFPYDGEGDPGDGRTFEERFTQWRLRDLGVPLIHGHVHDRHRQRLSKEGTPMLHAGLDAWDLQPVTLHDLTAALR